MLLKIILIFSFFLSLDAKDETKSNDAVVFMYHRFGEVKYPSTNITLKQFQFQLDYLEQNNYNVIHLSKLLNLIKHQKHIPPKTVSLSIDDAYLSVFTKAYPMLKQKGFEFSVFVNTNIIDNKSKSCISWEQMRLMQKNGAEFANHSLTHPYLLMQKNETKELWKNRVNDEVQKAQKRLQKELGENTNKNPKLFSYPFGEYDAQTIKLLKNLGYVGITQTSGTVGLDSDLMLVRRFPMAEAYASEEGFVTKLNTVEMPIESISPNESIIKNQNPPKLSIKLKKPLKNLQCFISSGEHIKIRWISQTEFEIIGSKPIKQRRLKYTCTAPAPDAKWYWFSHLWINKYYKY